MQNSMSHLGDFARILCFRSIDVLNKLVKGMICLVTFLLILGQNYGIPF